MVSVLRSKTAKYFVVNEIATLRQDEAEANYIHRTLQNTLHSLFILMVNSS